MRIDKTCERGETTCAARKLLAFNLKSLNNNASALIEARSQSAGVRSALKNV
jgi:hypothetical protein